MRGGMKQPEAIAVSVQRGFTLVEVLIAMSLLGIMVALLFGSLRTGAESWQRGETKIAEVNEKAVVYQFFKRHIPTIRPLWDEFSDDDERVFSFQGSSKFIQFVSVFPASAARKGLQLFSIEFDRDSAQILVSVIPFRPAPDDLNWEPDKVVLLEAVTKFELSYFDKGIDQDSADWIDSWGDSEYLPALIKISIELDDQSYWPEMVFALPMAQQSDSADSQEALGANSREL